VVAPAPKSIPIADPATLHAVNADILALCKLTGYDGSWLLDHGIPLEETGHYGTLLGRPQQEPLIDQLLAKYGRETLLSVPGFVQDGSRLRLNGEGLLVPIRDLDGNISAFQVRKDAGGYYFLSSNSAGGPSPGAPAHVVPGANTTTVLITEGARKAHIASLRMGITAIGMAGHAQIASSIPVLRALQADGALCVIIALDEDSKPETVAAVEQSRQALIRECLALGYAVRVARWDHSQGKGIDDLLLAGHQPRIEIVTSVSQSGEDSSDCGTRANGRQLMLSEQAARYREIRRVLWNHDAEDGSASMTPVQKLTLITSYELSDSYPTARPTHGIQQSVKTSMKTIGALVGCSAQTASKTLKSLAQEELVVRQDARENAPDGSVHTVIRIGAGRRLGFNEVLPEAEHHKADKERKRQCSACSSEDVLTSKILRHTCRACGNVEEEPLEAPPTHGIHESAPPVRKFLRQRPEWRDEAQATEEEGETSTIEEAAPTDSRNPAVGEQATASQNPCTDTTYTVIDLGVNSITRWPPTLATETEPEPGSLLVRKSLPVLELAKDADGVPLPPGAPRPDWPCPRCGTTNWLRIERPEWYCNTCWRGHGPPLPDATSPPDAAGRAAP
jgi:ribosomal protein L37AE/L43A